LLYYGGSRILFLGLPAGNTRRKKSREQGCGARKHLGGLPRLAFSAESSPNLAHCPQAEFWIEPSALESPGCGHHSPLGWDGMMPGLWPCGSAKPFSPSTDTASGVSDNRIRISDLCRELCRLPRHLEFRQSSRQRSRQRIQIHACRMKRPRLIPAAHILWFATHFDRAKGRMRHRFSTRASKNTREGACAPPPA
jgi:hypothetical protein